MKRKKYFYFASPHSFKYSFLTRLEFIKKSGNIIHRREHSKCIEAKNYNYYGEPVNCIITMQNMEYEFAFDLLSSSNNDNVFGAINYLLFNYREKFIQDIKNGSCPRAASDILLRYFGKDMSF